MAQTQRSFTGRRRQRVTRRSVRFADGAARVMITLGGIGTILAVSLVALFLLWVVWPLFVPASLEPVDAIERPFDEQPLYLTSDEYQTIGLAVLPDGIVRTFRLSDGVVLDERSLVEDVETTPAAGADGVRLTAASFSRDGDDAAFGFSNGTVRFGRIGFRTRFLSDEQVPEDLRDLPIGATADLEGGMVQVTPEGQFRLQQVRVELAETIESGSDEPVLLIDHVIASTGPVFAALTADQVVRVYSVREQRNLMTGQVTSRVRAAALPIEQRTDAPSHLKMTALGDSVYAVWSDGELMRFDTRRADRPRLAEQLDVVVEPDLSVTAVGFTLGRKSLAIGDSGGRVVAWSPIKPEPVTPEAYTPDREAVVVRSTVSPRIAERLRPLEPAEIRTLPAEVLAEHEPTDLLVIPVPDGAVLAPVHALEPEDGGGAPVTALAPSTRTRMLAVGYADGTLRIFYVTTGDLLVSGRLTEEPIAQLQMAPKDDAILAASAGHLKRWAFDPVHPETGFKALFTRVWYEGYPAPVHHWESTGGTDEFEMKLGMMPLIFGTLKATIYSMLFAVPLALLAAIYSSEFLHPKVKARIKPTIELMASLPSVVLGFLAGLVIAPFVDDIVPAMLALFVTVPLMFLVGGFLWQLLPRPTALLLEQIGQTPGEANTAGDRIKAGFAQAIFSLGGVRLLAMLALLAAGIGLALLTGPLLEDLLFAGHIKRWLDGQIGSGVGGWFIFLLPFSALVVSSFVGRVVNGWFVDRAEKWTRLKTAAANLVKFLGGFVASVLLALLLAWLLNTFAWDPRAEIGVWGFDLSPVDTYIQRNALIVGFAMGFAVIPIIYTIADDALGAVPEHLRSASLGSGATPWQTAVRVIIPTAMSGLFSACMIGLGRAVGETMIVLMAAGNTAVLELNIFNGFRTLSANIAVELPEAPPGTTHYRTLFLAALVLFIMTFLVNTVAEGVRQRFRKRAFEL